MSTTNGHVKTIPAAPVCTASAATGYISEAETFALSVIGEEWGGPNNLTVDQRIALAQVWATLAVAASDVRIADDEDRIASCVPEGGSALEVSLRR